MIKRNILKTLEFRIKTIVKALFFSSTTSSYQELIATKLT